MLCFFMGLCASWGPIFHQILGQEFADEYLTHFTQQQKDEFIRGSVYVDGLSRKLYHNISNLIILLNQFNSEKDIEYYFVLGFVLHMAVDSVGHIGYPLSYLPLKRPYHYFAELTCCSALLKDRNPPSISSNNVSDSVYMKIKNTSSKYFDILYKTWRNLAKLPFYKFLHVIEYDKCRDTNHKQYAMCNLDLHIQSMKRLMFDCMYLLNEGNLTDQTLGEIVIRELESIQCCSK